MSFESGARLGPYEISVQIGAGGMGEVYRARDVKLNRDVALKVLPDSFLHDADRLARFQREAHVLASLNHPNIAAIYGVEEARSTTALVIELVEGPTLAERVASGPVPLDEALPIALQIADALEAAHEQGIVHRDLKPANIKVKCDGTVKVLDFGLAKAMETAASGDNRSGPSAVPGLSQSPTITSPAMTQVGALLGTAAYMSPEQAKGRPADKRSDVWAFGCVLYEMLAGRRAFEGDDVSETLASVLKSDPDWTRLPSDVPHAIRTLIQRYLVKDRRLRVSDISAAKFVLRELSNIGDLLPRAATEGGESRSRWRRHVPVAAATVLTAVIVGAGSWARWPTSGPSVVAQFSFTLPEGHVLSSTRQAIAISPDGRQIVYAANSRLYRRSIDELEPHVIPGTENTVGGTLNPMFAPDGQSVAFFAQGDAPSAAQTNYILRRIPIGGGATTTIGTIEALLGANWGADGILLGQVDGIYRVSPTSGTTELIAPVAADERVYGPQMLPGGRAVLFTVRKNVPLTVDTWDKAAVVAQSLTARTRTVLIDGGSDARYLSSGHLVYSVAGTMFAAPLDAQNLAITSPPVPVIVGVRRTVGRVNPARHLAISETGTLVYVPGPAAASSAGANIVLGDGRGDSAVLKIPPGDYSHPRVSADGATLAVVRSAGQESDIWTYDLSGKTEIRRLTFGGNNRFPVWSVDGRHLAFQSAREGDRAIYSQSADGTSIAERLTKPALGEEHRPESWSPGGTRLLFSVVKDSKFALWVLTLDTKKSEPFGGVQSAETLGAGFSPDGRWIAYASTSVAGGTLSPNRGIFVQPFPATGEIQQAPKQFLDFHPVWAPDGKSIFYVPGATRSTVRVPVTTRPAIAFGTPVELPRGPFPGLLSGETRGYDVLPDGRFVSLAPASGDGPASASSSEIRVVLNWFEKLKQLAPAK
jgi:serine/threonine protein kinase